MEEKTGSNDSWQPMLGAEPVRLRQLGSLLRLRRAALGYRYMPAFIKARGTNTRMVSDIEKGRRDTYTFPSLKDVAGAYDVTYESMMAVVWSGAAELEPAPPAAPAGVVEQFPPWADAGRLAANRPYRDRINGRLDLLRGQGITSPSGAQLFPDSAADARDWDKYTADWEIRDRVWFLADLQRRAAGRDNGARSEPAPGEV